MQEKLRSTVVLLRDDHELSPRPSLYYQNAVQLLVHFGAARASRCVRP